MKTIKPLLSLFTLMMISQLMNAQVKDPAELQQMIDSKDLVFKARTAYPQSGRSWELTFDYDLSVNGGKLVSYLPYFGRAYSINPYSSEGGLQFTSTNFSYKTEKDKKGWDITIKPKDQSDVQQMFLEVSPKGYATLRVISTNRQNISYFGVIEKRTDK